MVEASLFSWIAFNFFIIALLALDLGIFHRNGHTVRFKEALLWSLFWVVLALLFNLGLYYFKGTDVALKFLTGYLIEKALSIDNLFVFLLIFNYFKVPSIHLHRILFWGVIGAFIFRGLFIAIGVWLISHFHFILYFFGLFLIYTGYKLAKQKDFEVQPENNPLIIWFQKRMPITANYEKGHFFIKKEKKWHATPLFLVLIAVETTDLIFALDSIPAIMAITLDPFIVYTSNVFAILGLRSIFFALSGMMELFHYLHYGLSLILIFIGLKMLMAEIYPVPIIFTLGFVAVVLTLSVVASLVFPKSKS